MTEKQIRAAIRIGGELIARALRKKGRVVVPNLGTFLIGSRTSKGFDGVPKSYVTIRFRPCEKLKGYFNV